MRPSFMVVFLFFAGCFHGRIVASGREGAVHSETGFSLFWGLTETKTAAIECRDGLASAGTYLPWYWTLLGAVTLGIVTPVVKEYRCVEGGQ